LPKLAEYKDVLRSFFGEQLDSWMLERGFGDETELDDFVLTSLYEMALKAFGADRAIEILGEVNLLKGSMPIKLFVCGNPRVGKTSFCRRFALGSFDKSYKSTIGVDFYSKHQIIERYLIRLVIWDLAGQERFGLMRPGFYKGSSGGFVAFSLVDEKSFRDVPGWVKEVRDNLGEVPMLLIGTKSDLGVKITGDPMKYVRELGFVGYLNTSALTGENINEAVRKLVEIILHKEGLI
jgi:small GTP-binding protein